MRSCSSLLCFYLSFFSVDKLDDPNLYHVGTTGRVSLATVSLSIVRS